MDQASSDSDRITQLREEIRRHNRLYYVEARPEISDRQFDELLKELQSLEQAHPQWVTADSPTQRVGGEPIEGFETYRHARRMLSIDNTYNVEELRAWFERTHNAVAKHEGAGEAADAKRRLTFVLEPKVDGVALSLRYENGQLVQALSRGDGRSGDEITSNVRTVRAVPLSLIEDETDNAVPSVLEIRGELFMLDEAFTRLNQQREEDADEPFANPRNATAGTLKQKDPSKVIRGLRFFAHGRGVVEPESFQTHQHFLHTVRSWGVPTNPYTSTATTFDEIWQFIEQFETNRGKLGYGTDGVVVKLNDYDLQNALGTTSKAPRWCIAYKYAAERASTRLREVRWSVGKTGKLTPRAIMDPVHLAGTTVQHASLHNSDELARLDLHEGDMLVVEKAGEIIPHAVEVDVGQRANGAKRIEPPKTCPSCGTPLVRQEDEVDWRCPNPQCPAQLRERLIWFAARNQMDIDTLGEKLIIKLVDAEVLQSFGDIYRLKDRADQVLPILVTGKHRREKIANVLAGKERSKMFDNLVTGIEQSKSRGLSRVLAGLGIRHVGGNAAQALARHFGDVDALANSSADRIAEEVTDIGPITAESVRRFLNSDVGRPIIEDLRDQGVDLAAPTQTSSGEQSVAAQTFAGKTIVLTGTLQHYARQNLADKLQAFGAHVTSSVSSKTDLVIVGENPGSKADKANQLGIQTWDEQRLREALG